MSDTAQKDHLKACIAQALEYSSPDSSTDANPSNSNHNERRGGFLFEGHLTVDPEPPRPPWLVLQSNLLNTLSAAQGSNADAASVDSREGAAALYREIIENIDVTLLPQVYAFLIVFLFSIEFCQKNLFGGRDYFHHTSDLNS